MEQKTRCIVLRTVKYGDDKLIIDFLTHEAGRLSALWKINTSSRSKVRRQMFQPLSILECEFETSPRQQLCKIREAHPHCLYSTLSTDIRKISIAFFLAEFLSFSTRDMHTDNAFYEFIEQSLTWLDMSERGIENFHLMFMLRVSRFLGFHPDVDSYHSDYIFDMREGRFSSSIPFHTDWLNGEEAKRMLLLLRMHPHNLHVFRMNRNERNRAVDLVLRYYRLHIPSFGEMKTLDVLRSL